VPLTKGFNHVATLSLDLEATKRFYAEAFEALCTFQMEANPEHPAMAILDLGAGAALNVFEVTPDAMIGERRRQGARGAIDHFALAVATRDELEVVRGRLVAAGAQEVGEVQRLGAEWSLFFRDADGMELEVCAPAD
jgi:catechol 2,3-dioxygenase-like lactoylglutathione lyase family enzyme